jgi:hypothetical protein
MPALPPVPKVLKTVVNFTCNLIPCANVFHIQYQGAAPTNANCAAIASSVHSFWSQNFIANLAPATLLQSVVVQDLSNQLGAQGSHVVGIPGAMSGAQLPSSVAIVGSWQIANRYRGGKPRTYISGLVQTHLADQQHFTFSIVTTMGNSFTGFMNSVNGLATPAGVGPFALGCVHYRHANAPLASPYFDPFVGVSVNTLVRSQRGRLT